MFSDLESFLLIFCVTGFSFFSIEDIRKPENYGRIQVANFQRRQHNYVTWGPFNSFFVQRKLTRLSSYCSMLEVKNKKRTLKVVLLWSKIGADITNWLLSSSFLVIANGSTGLENSALQSLLLISGRVFVFCHKANHKFR